MATADFTAAAAGESQVLRGKVLQEEAHLCCDPRGETLCVLWIEL